MAHETLKSLRMAVLLSRSMKCLAERGEIPGLILQMHERDLLLANVSRLLESMHERAAAGGPAEEGWPEILGVLREFEYENALLIGALKGQRRKIVRNIAEAEGHRKLAAYAV
ncbi:MAG TPA: hypothetical protein VK569_01655 [Bacteroidota bacterium]|nr:hypothetical protein [Bacteroidota bacterium]